MVRIQTEAMLNLDQLFPAKSLSALAKCAQTYSLLKARRIIADLASRSSRPNYTTWQLELAAVNAGLENPADPPEEWLDLEYGTQLNSEAQARQNLSQPLTATPVCAASTHHPATPRQQVVTSPAIPLVAHNQKQNAITTATQVAAAPDQPIEPLPVCTPPQAGANDLLPFRAERQPEPMVPSPVLNATTCAASRTEPLPAPEKNDETSGATSYTRQSRPTDPFLAMLDSAVRQLDSLDFGPLFHAEVRQPVPAVVSHSSDC
jgi:hypothetical protein